MSIKKFFDQTSVSRQYLTEQNRKDAVKEN